MYYIRALNPRKYPYFFAVKLCLALYRQTESGLPIYYAFDPKIIFLATGYFLITVTHGLFFTYCVFYITLL